MTKHDGWFECDACHALIPPESSWPATAHPESSIVCWGCGPGRMLESKLRAIVSAGDALREFVGRNAPLSRQADCRAWDEATKEVKR